MKQIGLTSAPEEQTENILTGICRAEDTTVFNYYLDIFPGRYNVLLRYTCHPFYFRLFAQ